VYKMHKVETGFTGSRLLYKCTRYKQINQDTKWKVDIWKMKGKFQLGNPLQFKVLEWGASSEGPIRWTYPNNQSYGDNSARFHDNSTKTSACQYFANTFKCWIAQHHIYFQYPCQSNIKLTSD